LGAAAGAADAATAEYSIVAVAGLPCDSGLAGTTGALAVKT
jgi:hypothetical protein